VTKQNFAERYRQEMADVQVSPQLRRRVLLAAQGKEEKPMKKKLSFAAVLALVLLGCCAAAIAVAYRAGILDFAGRYSGVYVPDDAQTYVSSDVLQLENDVVSVNVSELYYDGRLSRMTVEVKPKNPSTLLVGPTSFPEDAWRDLVHLNGEWDESDTRTIADVYQEGGYQTAYSVDTWIKPLSGEVSGGTGDNNLSPDGTLTLYCQVEYSDDQPRREAVFQLFLTPWETPLTAESAFLHEQTMRLEMPLTLEADTSQSETYVSTKPAEYPEAGVRVDRLTVEVRPQEIHAVIDYTITNRAVYDAADQGVWFEFIDPESKEAQPHAQRLQSGLSGGGSSGPVDGDLDTATKYRQTETLGRNELHEAYTLRAYNCWDKARYETHTFEMVKEEK